MKINFLTELTDLDGSPITDKDKPVTLKTISLTALLAQYADEQALSGEDKMKRFQIAEKIAAANADDPHIDLKAEEIAEIKKLIGKGFGPLIVGRCFNTLDPKGE